MLSHASYSFNNWHSTLWHFSISGRIDLNTLNRSKYKITNSSSFLNEAKNWLVKRNEVQVPYDIINLYPSVPINKALDVLIDQLNNDKNDLMKRTKLCLKDIYELAELCLSKCYFVWNNEIRILKNSGPIGLSFMVV